MALNRREILKFCGFIALNTAIYLFGVTIFMFLEYHYVKDPPVQNATTLKETIEGKIGGMLNASQFQFIFDSMDGFISISKSCSTPKYKQGWKKELTEATFARWLHFTATVVTTIGYGDVVLESDAGKQFLGFYVLFAIPVHLYTSYLVGKAITWILRKLLFFIELKLLHRVVVKREAVKVLVMSYLLSVAWGSIFTVLIMQKYKWTFVDASYFSIVSMTTIGFGDLTFEYKFEPTEMYLDWHLYTGTALVTSVIDGIVNLIKSSSTETHQEVAVQKENNQETHKPPLLRHVSMRDNEQCQNSTQSNGNGCDSESFGLKIRSSYNSVYPI